MAPSARGVCMGSGWAACMPHLHTASVALARATKIVNQVVEPIASPDLDATSAVQQDLQVTDPIDFPAQAQKARTVREGM